MSPKLTTAGNSYRRIAGLIRRHYYLLLGSKARLVELFYWPILNLLTWGYLNKFMYQAQATPLLAFGALLGGALLWEVTIRSQIGVMFGTIEEMWSRNLMQLFVSPLTPIEFLAATTLISLIRTTLAMLPCMVMVMMVFDFSIFSLGWAFGAFYALQLMTGWWMGILMAATLLRFGLGVEWLIWMGTWLLAPFTGAYYPVAVLPEWLQHFSWLLPPTYVFEGMRAILNHQALDSALLIKGLLLNLLYLGASWGIFLYAFNATRRHGGLMHSGE
jgi:ABC-2 type transport system permease protein